MTKSATESDKPNASEEEVVEADEVSNQETLEQEPEGAVESDEQKATAPEIDYKAEYEKTIRKYEKDIGAVKSVLDKKLADTQKSAEDQKRALEAQLDELRKKTLNEDDYKDYEKNRALERIAELQQELEKERVEKEQIKQFNYWQSYFTRELGIDADVLKADGSLEELFNSGMAAVREQVSKLKQTHTQSPALPKDSKKPPTVAKPSSSPATGVLSEEELAKKYANGDLNRLYEMAEKGRSDIAKLITEAAHKRTL